MENSQPPTERVYKNELIYQKSFDILTDITTDVNFIFETDTEEVQISANKAVLAASSPVFKAMFFSDLKEEGDIKIVDASSAAFKEFLQFFYEYEVKLTMENISDVLKLIDKYDVANGNKICTNFLKEHVKLDDIIWCLNLSIKYHLDKLKKFCKEKIEKNYKTVFDNIEFDKHGKICDSNDRFSDIDWECVLPQLFLASQGVIRNINNLLEKKRAIYMVNLASPETSYSKLKTNEIVLFSLDNPMTLTDIVCSKVYDTIDRPVEHSFYMSIERKDNITTWYSDILYTAKVDIREGQICVKLPTPIMILPQYVYAINFKSKITTELLYTTKSVVHNTMVQLAPSVNISFLGDPDKTLIAVLYFTHIS